MGIVEVGGRGGGREDVSVEAEGIKGSYRGSVDDDDDERGGGIDVVREEEEGRAFAAAVAVAVAECVEAVGGRERD